MKPIKAHTSHTAPGKGFYVIFYDPVCLKKGKTYFWKVVNQMSWTILFIFQQQH